MEESRDSGHLNLTENPPAMMTPEREKLAIPFSNGQRILQIPRNKVTLVSNSAGRQVYESDDLSKKDE